MAGEFRVQSSVFVVFGEFPSKYTRYMYSMVKKGKEGTLEGDFIHSSCYTGSYIAKKCEVCGR